MSISRRQFLSGASAAGAASFLPGLAVGEETPKTEVDLAGRGFTFVHVTDSHITRKRQGDKGYRRCLETIMQLRPQPAFLLMGGDMVFDGLYTPKSEYEDQIQLYNEITNSIGIPYYHCMGNHDVLGWSSRRKVSVNDPGFGKKMIMNALGWKKSYYSFDHGGWHFVVLDSIFPVASEEGPTYEPRIGKEQLEWLAYDLGAATGKPVIAVTHIAAFCNIGQQMGDKKRKSMDGHMVLEDTKELRLVLERHKVKALLQGHSHRIEDYTFNGVNYITSAAASGAWWSGQWHGCPPGYTLCHCRGEHLTWEHVGYDWRPRLEPEDDLERKRTEEYESFLKEQDTLRRIEQSGKLQP